MRNGWTLLELTVVLAVVGLVTLLATPRIGGWLDGIAVRRSVNEAATFYAAARYSAIARGTRVRVEFRGDSLTAVFEGVRDSVFLRRPGPASQGVTLQATRRVSRIHPNGLGSGGANTTLRFRRGTYEKRLILSRLGRLRRS